MNQRLNVVISALVLACASIAAAQDYRISEFGTVITCSGNFYDSGGSGGDYVNNENHVKTFYPAQTGAALQFAFTQFNTEFFFDTLRIYNGPNTTAPLIGSYSGTNGPVTIASTAQDGSLTFQFTSDSSFIGPGWAATISCGACQTDSLACDSSFTYQGQLRNNGQPYNGNANFTYSLYPVPTGGSPLGMQILNNTPVTNGLFTVILNASGEFGQAAFDGNPRWLQIDVNGTPLTTRQPLSPVPYAQVAGRLDPALPLVGPSLRVAGDADLTGRLATGGNVAMNAGRMLGLNPDDAFSYDGKTLGHYALGWFADPWNSGGATAWLSGYAGIKLFTNGTPKISINQGGNVGIGTTTPACSLQVNGGIRTRGGPPGANGVSNNGYAFSGSSGDSDSGLFSQADGLLQFFTDNAERMRISGGNVAIGTDTPEQRLSVKGSMQVLAAAAGAPPNLLAFGIVGNAAGTAEGTDPIGFFRRNAASNQSDLVLVLGDDPAPTPSSVDGFVIATTTANFATLTDRFRFESGGVAYKPGGGTWAAICDPRTKHDIQPMCGTLDKLLSLHGYAYEYNPDVIERGIALPGRQFGLLADEVETVFPDWISRGRDGYRYVTERSTTALMVEALRDLRQEKDAQLADKDREIAELKARLARIEARLDERSRQP